MKTINLIYNSKGFLEEKYEDGSFYIAKEEDKALTFKATFPASLVGSVRVYLQFRGGGDVVECGNININSHTVECAVEAKYLSYNFLKIGFEVITANKEIRFEPVTLEVDEFVNVGGKSSAEGYTVTVKVGNVTKLAPDEEPYVKNVGTSKDVIFDFGIPGGASKELSFDYYYTFDSMTENYDEFMTPGLYKIRHEQGGNAKVVMLIVRKFSSVGYFQMRFTPNQILVRKTYANEDGTISWNDWVKFTTESDVDAKLESKANKELAFDYYYETDTLNWDDDNYKRVGIHKIHVNSSTPWVAIILTRNWMSGLSQLRIISNLISFRLIKSTGEMLNWVGYVNQDALNEQFDEKIGDIETALDTIIAMQNELTGGGEV